MDFFSFPVLSFSLSRSLKAYKIFSLPHRFESVCKNVHNNVPHSNLFSPATGQTVDLFKLASQFWQWSLIILWMIFSSLFLCFWILYYLGTGFPGLILLFFLSFSLIPQIFVFLMCESATCRKFPQPFYFF